MPQGRTLSLTLLALGAVLLAVGAGVAIAAIAGLLIGTGVGIAVFGVLLLLAGLFLVPVGRPDESARQQPIHGVIP